MKCFLFDMLCLTVLICIIEASIVAVSVFKANLPCMCLVFTKRPGGCRVFFGLFSLDVQKI